MNMSGESMFPTPNTTVVRAATRFGHFTHASARSRNAVNAASFSGDELVMGCWLGGAEIAADTATRGAPSTGSASFGNLVRAEAVFDAPIVGDLKLAAAAGRAGKASERKCSGVTATWRTPRDFIPSRC